MAGRRTKLTPEVQQDIITAIKAGNYIQTAAAYAGIHKATFFRWYNEGEQAKSGKKRDFYEAVVQARAQAESLMVSKISKAAQSEKNWQAAAWWLERSFPDRWGKRVHEHTGKDGGPIEHEQHTTLVEEIAAEPEAEERIIERYRQRIRSEGSEK